MTMFKVFRTGSNYQLRKTTVKTFGNYSTRDEADDACERLNTKLRLRELCSVCRFNTNDFVCHPHCSGCDDDYSKFVQRVPKNQL